MKLIATPLAHNCWTVTHYALRVPLGTVYLLPATAEGPQPWGLYDADGDRLCVAACDNQYEAAARLWAELQDRANRIYRRRVPVHGQRAHAVADRVPESEAEAIRKAIRAIERELFRMEGT